MSTSFTDRSTTFKKFLDHEHYRFRCSSGFQIGSDEVGLSSEWCLLCEAPASPLTVRMLHDFRRFCRECLEVSFADSGKRDRRIIWRLAEPQTSGLAFDRQDCQVEAFQIKITDQTIEILARHERGLLHATHHLEWMMADRGGPSLPRTTIAREPQFAPRISNGVFIPGHQSIQSPGDFSDEYLALMSHYGVNGIFIYVDFWTVFKNQSLPELNSIDFDEKIAALRCFTERTLRFGIDVYLHLNTPPLMEDHPVFQAHPETRGALVEIYFEGLSGKPWYNLCSGSDRVLSAFYEATECLFNSANEVAGAVMIIGGECFMHCYTRPAKSENGSTNCPHCQGKAASEEVANLVNIVKRAVKTSGTHKALYAWPYSAFIWSAQDPHQLTWIDNLDPDVSVLSNFDCGDTDLTNGAGVKFFDYNIKCIGPSETFAMQAKRLASKQRPIFAKVESSTTPDAFFVPYLPLYYRWTARWSSLLNSGVKGFVGQWRFFGMNGSSPEEIQYKVTWYDKAFQNKILENIIRRDFSLSEEAIDEVLIAYAKLSSSWDLYPYSAMTSGERAAYMRGPMYLGPSHPLIFDVQDHYNLPDSFRELRGDMAEMASPEELIELRKKAKPRYISDLLITLPFGVERYLELIKRCRLFWEDGMFFLRKHLAASSDRARLELNVCETIGSHLRTLENVVRFYNVRDALHSRSCNIDEFRARLDLLKAILDDEITNAENILPILLSDVRCGYGHSYGPAYNPTMVLDKIAQCKYVRDTELPRFSSVVRFHVWLDSP